MALSSAPPLRIQYPAPPLHLRYPAPRRRTDNAAPSYLHMPPLSKAAVPCLKDCMTRGYSYIEGIEELLFALKTNILIWELVYDFLRFSICRCEMVEDKLKISRYISWTFCSFKNGKSKPDPDFYMDVVNYLEVEPENCDFVDDRMKNVEAARAVGIVGVHFKNATTLRRDLSHFGVDVSE